MISKAHAEAEDMERALLVLNDMITAGMVPDEMISTSFIDGCARVCNHELGDRIFRDMATAQVSPSGYTLTAMLKMYGRCGLHDKADELVATWKATYGEEPSVIHYSCIIRGRLKNKQPDEAWQLFMIMEQSGIGLDS